MDTAKKLEVLSKLMKKRKINESGCVFCIQGKMRREAFPVGEGEKVSAVLERIHTDIMGPITLASHSMKRFIINFVDEASRYICAVAIARKSDALEEFKKYKARVEVIHEKKIKELQSDNARELTSREFKNFLEKHGILHRRTVAYTPQQNGLAERTNLTLCNTMRCMLIQSGVPGAFWAEALQTACYLRNRCPSSSLGSQTPLEK